MPEGYVTPMLTARQPAKLDTYFGGDKWVLEPKYDGIRLTVHRGNGDDVRAWARPQKGAAGVGAVHRLPTDIKNDLIDLPLDSTFTLDCELVAAQGGISSDALTHRYAKNLVVFDVLLFNRMAVYKLPYRERRAFLEKLSSAFERHGRISIPPVIYKPTWKDVEKIWEAGGEGGMLKNLDSTYLPGRRVSTGWIKVKRQFKDEGVIVGFKKGTRGAYSRVIMRKDDGRLIEAKAQENLMAAGKEAIGLRTVFMHSGELPSGRFRHPQAYFGKRT